MSNLTKFLEKQNQIWTLIIGIALIAGGFYFFFYIKDFEDAGIEVSLPRYAKQLYKVGGKYTILAMFEIVGLIALISGIRQLTGKNKTEGLDE